MKRRRLPPYDAIVVGVGAMGSAALYHLAQRGRHVLGIERFETPNERGSSHGLTRIIRFAYHESPSYVPLVIRSAQLWAQLQEHAGETLMRTTGSIDAGRSDQAVVRGAIDSCAQHGLPHEVLSATDVHRRFPGYRLPDDMTAVYQPEGGFLIAERCIEAHIRGAQEIGAELHTNERVLDWKTTAEGGVVVRTNRHRYEGERLVLAAGAWMNTLAPVPTTAERQVLAWLTPRHPELFDAAHFPVFVIETPESRILYGFPHHAIPGFKVGLMHHLYETGEPDALGRNARPEDEELLRNVAGRFFPDGAGPALTTKTCLFENSPDRHFLVGPLPGIPQVLVAGGFSGHGFKFATVIGEILADLAIDGRTSHDIDFLRLERLTEPTLRDSTVLKTLQAR